MRVTVQVPTGVSDPASYYWKSVTYDVYTGHGWATSATQEARVSTGQKLFRSLPGQTQTLHQSFQLVQPADGQIYAAGSLMRLDRPSTAAWRTPGEDLFGVSAEGINYQLDSAWPVYSIEDLRGDAQTLPDDVRGRYLQLPDGIPTEVLALARDLTASQATEYDQAKAIEAYLRTLPYSLDVPQPPVSGDIVDVFLFQLKTGYCDYYASAMVVLARAVGIPARIAVGYATGEATQVGPGRISYLVTAAEAHTWVEIYFAGVGWVPFEPTAGRPPLDQVEAVLPARAEPTGARAGSSAGVGRFDSARLGLCVGAGGDRGRVGLAGRRSAAVVAPQPRWAAQGPAGAPSSLVAAMVPTAGIKRRHAQRIRAPIPVSPGQRWRSAWVHGLAAAGRSSRSGRGPEYDQLQPASRAARPAGWTALALAGDGD